MFRKSLPLASSSLIKRVLVCPSSHRIELKIQSRQTKVLDIHFEETGRRRDRPWVTPSLPYLLSFLELVTVIPYFSTDLYLYFPFLRSRRGPWLTNFDLTSRDSKRTHPDHGPDRVPTSTCTPIYRGSTSANGRRPTPNNPDSRVEMEDTEVGTQSSPLGEDGRETRTGGVLRQRICLHKRRCDRRGVRGTKRLSLFNEDERKEVETLIT